MHGMYRAENSHCNTEISLNCLYLSAEEVKDVGMEQLCVKCDICITGLDLVYFHCFQLDLWAIYKVIILLRLLFTLLSK